MISADASSVSASAVGAPTTIALFDGNGLLMVTFPYQGGDPPGVLAAMLARWQGFGSSIAAGSVFDQEGQTLAHAKVQRRGVSARDDGKIDRPTARHRWKSRPGRVFPLEPGRELFDKFQFVPVTITGVGSDHRFYFMLLDDWLVGGVQPN